MKGKMVTLRVPDHLINEYKKFCDDNSFTLSKRIRKLIEMDLEKWRAYKIEKAKELALEKISKIKDPVKKSN